MKTYGIRFDVDTVEDILDNVSKLIFWKLYSLYHFAWNLEPNTPKWKYILFWDGVNKGVLDAMEKK